MNKLRGLRPDRGRKPLLIVFLFLIFTFSIIFGMKRVDAQFPQALINIDLSQPNTVNSTVFGAGAGSHLGGSGAPGIFANFTRARAIVTGDFNADGIPDVAIGAPETDLTDRTDAGAVYIVFGRTTAFPTFFDSNQSVPGSQPNVRIFGPGAGTPATDPANLGFALAAGDVNGDNVTDLLIGAPGADFPGVTGGATPRADTGAVFIIFGSTLLANGTILDLGAAPPATPAVPPVSIYGVATDDLFGSAIQAGNIGGPTGATPEQAAVRDIFVGAPGSIGPGPMARAGGGAAYLLYGGSGLNPTPPAPTRTIDLGPGTTTPANAVIFGAAGDALGSSLAIGNINAGSERDLIVGAPGANRPVSPSRPALDDTGATYVFFGGTNLIPGAGTTTKTFDVASTTAAQRPNISIYGADDDDQMGKSVASDDVTGDGTDDLAIGVPDADGRPGAERVDSGEAYVIPGTITINPEAAATERRIDVGDPFIRLTIFGAAAGDHFGETVATGSFNVTGNTDQRPDLFVGAPGALSGRGAISMFFGGPNLTFLPVRDTLPPGQDDVLILGQEAGDELGWAIATADVNSDTGSDLIAGAPFANVGSRVDAGEAYIVLARGEGIPPVNNPPVVKVLTPNSGTVPGGSNFNITWEASDPDGDGTLAGFDIFLSTNGGNTFNTQIATGLSGAARSFNWAVPTGLNTTTARIRVTVTDDKGAAAQDDSDNNFTIIDVGVTVTLTQPNGGQLKFGQDVLIQWTVPTAQEPQVRGFDLFLLIEGGATTNITPINPTQPALAAGIREFMWKVPNTCVTAARVLVRATTILGATSQDQSDASFSITDNGPTIDVNRMEMNSSGTKLKLRTNQPPVGSEIVFAADVRVEISNAAGQFFTFEKIRVKRNGKLVDAKGDINGVDLEDFFPDQAVRTLRVTNLPCGIRELRIQRNGRNFVQVTTAAAEAEAERVWP